MELLFLLLMITTQIQQSESANCTIDSYDYRDMDVAGLNFEGLDGVSCSLYVKARFRRSIDQCLDGIEIVNTSCLLDQSSVSPTTTVTVVDVCMNQTLPVESTKFITIISTHTQAVYSQTTVSIYPMPTPSSGEDTSLLTSTVSTVYITRSSDSTSTPTTRFALSNAAQIGILATSGVLMCLLILAALVIVIFCWIRTRRTLKEKRNEVRFDHSAQDSIPSRRKNISEAAPLSLNSNPAYAAWKPLQKNIAYEDTTLTTVTTREKESQQSTNTQVSAYEIVPLASCQSASTNAHTLKN